MTKSYWTGNGKYQTELENLSRYIPQMGQAADQKIEVLRIAQNIYYDINNNGGVNIVEDLEEFDALMRKFPNQKVLDYIREYAESGNEPTERSFQLACVGCDEMIDKIIEWIYPQMAVDEVKA